MRDRCDSALDRYPDYPPGFSPRELNSLESEGETNSELEEQDIPTNDKPMPASDHIGGKTTRR